MRNLSTCLAPICFYVVEEEIMYNMHTQDVSEYEMKKGGKVACWKLIKR